MFIPMTKEEVLAEISEWIAKESKAYKQLKKENRKLKKDLEFVSLWA